ncbi:hypothetical protein CTAYLR_002913 [Chrysophaeum taylorii]|uniref:Cyclin N-terminal domain-containing protein n=1 Tax=Chrysophaeum taylorii TaxID=2483200 RepID=A0AAD7UM33_9STRA|nr:hypothetical protein CTAYLR_002913 [Chrysophaeum taylorii]
MSRTIAAPLAASASADVTWTCTFNGRRASFFEALESFVAACAPATQRRIRDWIVVADAGANIEDRVAIMRRAPWLTLICKGPSMYRHARSLNLLATIVRTKWWLQWEDDWRVDGGGSGDLVERAIAAAVESGCSQVAVNGAFLDGKPGDYDIRRENGYAVIALGQSAASLYPPDEPSDVLALRLAPLRAADEDPPPWPLFSLQPSLLDADFIKRHVAPFAEGINMNDPSAYWLWELDAAIRFVRAGGTKASLSKGPLATQIHVRSSSHLDDDDDDCDDRDDIADDRAAAEVRPNAQQQQQQQQQKQQQQQRTPPPRSARRPVAEDGRGARVFDMGIGAHCLEQLSPQQAVRRLRAAAREECHYAPLHGYVNTVQTDGMTSSWRSKIITWYHQLADSFHLDVGTIYTAVNYLDRFLSKSSCNSLNFRWMPISRRDRGPPFAIGNKNERTDRAQATKIEERRPILATQFCDLSENIFVPADLRRMELELLAALKWRLHPTTQHAYVGMLVCLVDAEDSVVETLEERADVLLNSALYDLDFLKFTSSLQAVSAIMCAMRELNLTAATAHSWLQLVKKCGFAYLDSPNAERLVNECGTKFLRETAAKIDDDVDAEVAQAMDSAPLDNTDPKNVINVVDHREHAASPHDITEIMSIIDAVQLGGVASSSDGRCANKDIDLMIREADELRDQDLGLLDYDFDDECNVYFGVRPSNSDAESAADLGPRMVSYDKNEGLTTSHDAFFDYCPVTASRAVDTYREKWER